MESSPDGRAPSAAICVSLLVPVYNGAPYLERCLEHLVDRLATRPPDWEIIVCEDGSTDGTKRLCDILRQRFTFIRFIQRDQRLGRGGALRKAVEVSKGDLLAYIDVDMATDLRCLDDLLAAAAASDVVTGSRYATRSRVRRRFLRYICSRTYNALVRAMFSSKVRDHQCGFKAFRRDALIRLLPEIQSDHWFWDTELLVRAQLEGLRVDEIPIEWSETASGTTVRLSKDIPYFLREMLALRKSLSSGGGGTALPPRST